MDTSFVHRPQKPATTTPAANQQTNNTKYKIINTNCKIELFPTKKKNRRFTTKEYEQELEIAKLFQRPPRQFFYDTPFYPWVPPTPLVNFDLKYKE